jgi:divalent metal cation (Fe/Co/Zn/Cd) transporter
LPGIVHVALSPAVLPFLPAAQRTAGRALGSAGAVADSKQTLLSTYLSAVLLVGLLASSLFGWSWADPVAALVIAAVAVKEGRDAWRGDACCGDACCGPLPTTSAGSSAAPAADASGCRPGCDCC